MSPEFSRPVPADRATAAGTEIRVVATAEECGALAARLMLPAIERLACTWTLRPSPGGVVVGQGVLSARVTQSCVVSLDPFPAEVAESFTVHFVRSGHESDDDDPEAPDEVPYDGTTLDLGEATTEQLALALDPYPRKPGAVLDAGGDDLPAEGLAALARWGKPN